MYKRIIHNIVEECYYDNDMSGVLVKSNQRLVKAASDLQLVADQLITSLVSNVRIYMISLLESSTDAADSKNKVIYYVNELGRTLDGFYGSDASAAIVMNLKNFIDSIDRIIALAKTGSDYAAEFATALTYIDSAAVAISDLNTEYWPESVVKKYLRAYAGLIVDQIAARIKENWELDASFSNYANRIMYNGPVSIDARRGMPDFAEVFAAGIFRQFPQKF